MNKETAFRETRVDWNTVFGALADGRRRHVLAHLEANGPTSLADLVCLIVDREGGHTSGDATAGQRERVWTALFHVHLPRLVDENLVEWEDEETVTLAESTAAAAAATLALSERDEETTVTAIGEAGSDD